MSEEEKQPRADRLIDKKHCELYREHVFQMGLKIMFSCVFFLHGSDDDGRIVTSLMFL